MRTLLKCRICGKTMYECKCGEGCEVCGGDYAIYAIPVCGKCSELPIDTHIAAVVNAADAYVKSIEAEQGDGLGQLVRAVSELRAQIGRGDAQTTG